MNKVQICIPTREAFDPGFVISLLSLYQRHPELEIPFLGYGGAIHSARQELVEGALGKNCSHVLFLDSDHTFAPQCLERLLNQNKDVIGANYLNRHYPNKWTARKLGKNISSIGKEGLEQVETNGLGLCLIKAEVFKGTPRPWFDMVSRVIDSNGSEKVEYGFEDMYFCRKVAPAGFKVWIDHDLSQVVDHSIQVRGGVKGLSDPCSGISWTL